LVDGGYYTVPEFSIYSLEGKWVMENEGVHPDIEIDNLPDRKARGNDDQLDAAVDYILKKLRDDPKELPSYPGPPAER
jgi:tricorn protease